MLVKLRLLRRSAKQKKPKVTLQLRIGSDVLRGGAAKIAHRKKAVMMTKRFALELQAFLEVKHFWKYGIASR